MQPAQDLQTMMVQVFGAAVGAVAGGGVAPGPINSTYKYKRWSFTVFGLEVAEAQALKAWKGTGEITFIVIGLEQYPVTGRQHLQGYVELKTRQRLSWMKRHPLPNSWLWQPARGTAKENWTELKKNVQFWSWSVADHMPEESSTVEQALPDENMPGSSTDGIALALPYIPPEQRIENETVPWRLPSPPPKGTRAALEITPENATATTSTLTGSATSDTCVELTKTPPRNQSPLRIMQRSPPSSAGSPGTVDTRHQHKQPKSDS